MIATKSEIDAYFLLRDGTPVRVRPIRPDDVPRLQAFFAKLSPPCIFNRFLTYRKELTRTQAEYFACVDQSTRVEMVSTIGEGEREQVIGLAGYDLLPPADKGIAEAAVVIQDEFQGLRLGTEMLFRLANHAQRHGVRTMVGTIHCENDQMLRWLEKAGIRVGFRNLTNDGAEVEVRVELPTE